MLSGTVHRPYDQTDTKQNKRYAQHLTEIHAVGGDHLVFRVYLDILDILDQETGKEDSDEKYSGDQPWTFLVQYIHMSRPKSRK